METKPIDPFSGTTRAEIALLLDFYGNALTDRQRKTAELYFQEDLSLTEIAELFGVTRQAVRDGLKKAEAALFQWERQLGIAARFLQQRKRWEQAKTIANALPDGEEKDRLTALVAAALSEI